MNKLMRKLGFSLIEVIIGSVIIAGFVGTTVYTAGEIGAARRESLASFDRNTWATLQTQYAAQGVMAPTDNVGVWGANNFGNISNNQGSLYFNNNLTSGDLDANTVNSLGVVGQSVTVNAFRVGLTQAGVRENANTVGLLLMDRSNYSNTGGNGGQGVVDPGLVPMDKPNGLFDLGTAIAVAKFNPGGAIPYVVTPSSTVTLDALSEINWDGTVPAFYVLLRATIGAIDTADCYLNGNLINASNTAFNGYDFSFPVTLADLNTLGTNLLYVTTVAQDPAGNVATGRGSVTITPVRPTLTHTREEVSPLPTNGTITTDFTVDICDVMQPQTKTYQKFRTTVETLNGTSVSTLLASPTLAANTAAVLNHLSLYDYIDSSLGIATVSSNVSAVNSLSGTKPYVSFGTSVTAYNANCTSFVWRSSTRGDSLTTPYSALIAEVKLSSPLTITMTPRPSVLFSPVTGSTIESLSGITAYASAPILGSGVEDILPTPSLYYLYYNYGINNMGEVPTPTLSAYNGRIDSYTGSVNLGSLQDGTTVYVKAIALPSALDANNKDPYRLFLSSSSQAQTSGTYMYDSDPYKVLAYVNILDNINGYVQGSIQVRDACSFNANGSASVGFELRLNYEPTFTLNGDTKDYFHYYSTNPASSYYLSSSDVLNKVANNSSDVYIIGSNKTYTLNNQSFSTSTSSGYHVALNIRPVSIETSISPKDPEGVYPSAFNNCTTDYTVENGKTLTLAAGGTYYYNNLTVRNGGSVVVSGSGTATLYVKYLTDNGGTIGNSDSVTSLTMYFLNSIDLNGKVYGRLHCGTYVKTSTPSSTSPDGFLHNYTAGKVTMNAQCVVAGKIWCYELNMNGQCELRIQ